MISQDELATNPTSEGTVTPSTASQAINPTNTAGPQERTILEGNEHSISSTPVDVFSGADSLISTPMISTEDITDVSEVVEETPIPIEAPKSTIPDVVETVEDIYDFDGLSGRLFMRLNHT